LGGGGESGQFATDVNGDGLFENELDPGGCLCPKRGKRGGDAEAGGS